MFLQVPVSSYESNVAFNPWFCHWCTGFHLLDGQWCCDIYILNHQVPTDTIKSPSCQSRFFGLSDDGDHVSTHGYQLLLWNLGSW